MVLSEIQKLRFRIRTGQYSATAKDLKIARKTMENNINKNKYIIINNVDDDWNNLISNCRDFNYIRNLNTSNGNKLEYVLCENFCNHKIEIRFKIMTDGLMDNNHVFYITAKIYAVDIHIENPCAGQEKNEYKNILKNTYCEINEISNNIVNMLC